MGVFIDLDVAHDVENQEWEPVYEESLRLAKKFQLMDSDVVELFGERLCCGIPVEEREDNGYRFWCVIGDCRTMGQAEEQSIPRKLDKSQLEQKPGKSYDPLLHAAGGCGLLPWKDERCQNSYSFFGNKTQGEAYHIYLLAIGCMIESRLHGKACVGGDITLEQCREAVDLANEYLSEPIGMPVRCDLEQLYRRIRGLPLNETEPLELFEKLYFGPLDRDYGEFVKAHFSREERIDFWRKEFLHHEVGTSAFSSNLKKYFNRGYDLEELYEIIQFTEKSDTEDYEQFAEEMTRTNQLLQEYDICSIRDLLYYESGDKLKPDLEKACTKYIKFYKEVCGEKYFADLMQKSAEERCAFLIHQNRYLFLMKNRWLEIFDEIKKNQECFKRYYPMGRVEVDSVSVWVVYAYVVNDDFYHYCEDKIA